MKFTPHPQRIWFSPINQQSIIDNDKDSVIEAGKVLGVGSNVTFVKEGDTVFFISYGAEKTPEIDGESYWVLRDEPQFVLGKLSND